MKITVGSVCFVKNKEKNEILFLKRNKEPMAGMYTGVGGKTEANEDVSDSCVREVKEETGLDVLDLRLEGIIKTVLKKDNSSWILFIYTTENFSGEIINCNEGDLEWLSYEEAEGKKLIGFIREMLPAVFDRNKFIEGTIWHDEKGEVVNKKLRSF